jgi:hypothetical protein
MSILLRCFATRAACLAVSVLLHPALKAVNDLRIVCRDERQCRMLPYSLLAPRFIRSPAPGIDSGPVAFLHGLTRR